MAVFSVTDTGCGIPKEKQALVFERFEKLNEYAQGTGLGLSICKLIVYKWKGEIWIDPDYTGGARFVFSHPLNIEKNETIYIDLCLASFPRAVRCGAGKSGEAEDCTNK